MAIDITKFIQRFVEEARDHLRRLGDGIAALEAGQAEGDTIHALFRSAHTIKGSSRMLKLAPITEVAHRLEDVLGGLREGQITFTPALGQLLYRTVDDLAAQVDRLAEAPDPARLAPADAALCQALAEAAQGGAAGPAPEAPAPVEEAPAGAAAVTAPSAPAIGAPAPPPPPPPSEHRLKTGDTVRVRLTKLDELIKLMGEVVTSHARLRQRVTELTALERALPEAAAEGPWQAFARHLRDDVQVQELLMRELHDRTLLMRMLPLAIVFEPASRLARELARSVGKQVECLVSGAEIELDRQIIDRLADPIVHLIRNALDHGIEPPAVRIPAGKPAAGRLRLSARQDGGWVVIEVADDGGGIPVAAVREKALRKGLITPERAAALGDREVLELIFLPGFSTAPIITDLSGRGVGMDVVRRTVLDDLQGAVEVDSRPGAGSTFTLRLPLSLAVMRVLLVAVEGLPFGFTAQHVAELLRIDPAALMPVADRQAILLRNEFIPVVPLADLVCIPAGLARPTPPVATPGEGCLLVVLRVRDEKIAVRVDELLDERDMVIKPLPEHMRRLPLASGVVVTGRNELVSILHAPALLDLARRLRGRGTAASAAAETRSYRVLVVDDSLNTREIERDVLAAHGYDVTLAEDGVDGLAKAQAAAFDAVLTDVEMPRMDGFTLTARLRADARYRSVPIVIVTSREREEDKRRGLDAGADAYIVKGDFEQSNLVDTLRALLG